MYKDLLKENPSLYIPKLAELFYKKADYYQKLNKMKKAKKYYTKALKIFNELKIVNPAMGDKLKDELQQIDMVTPTKEGWIYVGEFIDEKWKKQSLGFENINPSNLKLTKQIAIDKINIRKTASIKAKVNGLLTWGDVVKIIDIKIKYEKNDLLRSRKYIWTQIEY
jgi:tetratricopeptide (TPR) repeat protein